MNQYFAVKASISLSPKSNHHHRNYESKKRKVLSNLLTKQKHLEKESISILAKLNSDNCEAAEITRLSEQLSYICKEILDVRDTIEDIDIYILEEDDI